MLTVQEQFVQHTKQIRESRTALTQILTSMDPKKLVELIIAREMGESVDMSVPADVAPPPPVASNIERSSSGRRGSRLVGNRPSLSWAMQIVISEAGAAMHGNDILKALVARKWDPKTKSTEKKLANIYSVLSSQKKVFRSDKDAGKGCYGLVPGFKVDALPSSVDVGKKAAPAAKVAKPMKAKAGAKVAANGKKPTHKPLADRKPIMGKLLKLLKESRGQVTSPDLAKQLKVEPNVIQGGLLALMKSKSLKKGKENEEGAALFTIDRDNLNAHIKRFDAAN